MRISPWISILITMVMIARAAAAADVPNHAVVLLYHHVDTETPASTSVSPALFAEHLDYLDRHGFRVEPLGALVDSLRNGRAIPDRSVALTFDDGYRSVYTEAFPRLKELGWPFTVFVCPADIDAHRGPVLTWDQLREMASAGATVANHGQFHRHLQRRGEAETDPAWRARTRHELQEAQDRITEEIGQAPALFAYPYGEFGPDLQGLIRELGWTAFGQQSGPLGEAGDWTLMPRFPMAGPYAALETFGEKVASLPFPVVSVQPVDPAMSEGAGPEERRPVLNLVLGPGDFRRDQAAAFASGQGAADLEWVDREAGILQVRARRPLPAGRSRYNFTAPATDGRRYYWYSHTWIVGQSHKD